MLFINLFYLGVFCLVALFIFNLFLFKNKLLLKTICIFLLLHVALVAFISIEQHRFKINLSKSIFMDDGESYSGNGWQISTALTNAIPDLSSIAQMRGIHVVDRCLGLKQYYDKYISKKVILSAREYEVGYISYFYAIIYAAYGFKPVLINFLNIMLHLFTAIIIYQSVNVIFNKRAAYLAALFFLLNPVAFYYASTKLQESLFIFIVYLSIYCFLMIIKKKNYGYIFLIPPLFYVIYAFIKTQYFFPLVITFTLSSVIILFQKNKIILFILSLFILFAISTKYTDAPEKIKNFTGNMLIKSVERQRAFYNSEGINYQLYLSDKNPKDYTLTDWVSYVSSGWYHMLNEPILSDKLSLKLLLLYPYKLIFLFLCILAVAGILMALRYGYIDAIIFVCLLVVVGSSIAIFSGNIGSVLRHRNLVVPVIFIFSSFYISKLLPDNGPTSKC